MKLIEDPFRFVTLSRWQNKTSKVYVANAAVLVMAALPYFVSFRFLAAELECVEYWSARISSSPERRWESKPKQSTL